MQQQILHIYFAVWQCAANFNITCFIDTYGFKDFQGPQGTHSKTLKHMWLPGRTGYVLLFL